MSKRPILMLLISAAIALSLSMTLVPLLKADNPQSTDILSQFLGGTAGVAADMAYEEADIYFHAGVPGGCPEKRKGREDEQHLEAGVKSDLPLSGLVSYLNGEMAPKKHRHLEGAEEKELIPWFVATVRLNPHLVDAWCTGSYWYYRTGDKKNAERFITQGIQANPHDYHLYMERGAFYHRCGRYRECIDDMLTAKRYWKNSSEDAPFDFRAIKIYLKDAKEKLERKKQ